MTRNTPANICNWAPCDVTWTCFHTRGSVLHCIKPISFILSHPDSTHSVVLSPSHDQADVLVSSCDPYASASSFAGTTILSADFSHPFGKAPCCCVQQLVSGPQFDIPRQGIVPSRHNACPSHHHVSFRFLRASITSVCRNCRISFCFACSSCRSSLEVLRLDFPFAQLTCFELSRPLLTREDCA